ncbi:MAG: hypothetical protein GXP32_06230 [Kiritimatiellaeota bacterium]|nr:hypothetical protein [Kiritimatiellota bacterium]
MTAQSSSFPVFVSGMGIVSAAGADLTANLKTMFSGERTPSQAPTLFDSDLGKPVFECDPNVKLDGVFGSERTLALAMKALSEAMADANLAESDLAGPRVGVALGSTVACMLNSVDFYAAIRTNGVPDPAPLERYLNGDISERVAAEIGASGPRSTIANACSSGSNAITMAFSWLESGLCDIAVAGGADELSLIPYCGFNSLQIMGDVPCAPFDAERRGLTLGEGAGILILETERSLKRRGAEPKALLAACGSASDAYHLTGPHPDARGLKKAVLQALESADATPNQVDYVNAHGTATLDNDRIEGKALFDLFGEALRYSSTKYYTGHTLAAAGAIEAVVCVAGLTEGRFPGSPLKNVDPEIPLQPSSEPIAHNGGFALSTSMAFGGTCVALLFAPCESFHRSPAVSRPAHSAKIAAEPEIITIASCGVIGPFGRGLESLKAAIRRGNANINNTSDEFSVPDDLLNGSEFKKMRRRADKISLMALASATDAATAANLAERDIRELAVIFASSFGAHNSTFKFLDSLLDYGHSAPSPTSFSNSVHNAPTFHISQALGIQGSSVTMTAFDSPFAKALTYAESLVASGGAERVLLVVGDEVNDTMRRISDFWTEFRKTPSISWGEGSVAFVLEKAREESAGSSDGSTSVPDLMKKSARFAETAVELFGHTLFNDALSLACALSIRS